jgi:hypothetical protein
MERRSFPKVFPLDLHSKGCKDGVISRFTYHYYPGFQTIQVLVSLIVCRQIKMHTYLQPTLDKLQYSLCSPNYTYLGMNPPSLIKKIIRSNKILGPHVLILLIKEKTVIDDLSYWFIGDRHFPSDTVTHAL